MTPLFVGVDGGGSHTRVVVADATGREVSRAESRGSAVRPGQVSASAQIILEVVGRALEGQAGIVRALGVGVAGVGREDEREALERALEAGAVAQETIVVSDAEIALEDAFGDGPGILLTAGTGSIAFGRGPTGSVARTGGWGPVFGDEGSGAWIGRRALGIVGASSDGREPETGLTAPLLDAVGVEHVSELITWAAGATPADLARLAPVVLEVAATGDLRGNSLVTLAIEELGLHVRALARLLFADERAAFQLAFNGGLLQRGSLLRRRLEQRLKSMTPGAQVHAAEPVPARGAVRLAMREAGFPVAPADGRPTPTSAAPPNLPRPAATGA